ncbi:hypothetical protein PENSPDRAFT_749925 [Peniophora sp. CONT]|nr:hypothetical protein PENSPDRAFT_749925 [Peniophora sp. CONT]
MSEADSQLRDHLLAALSKLPGARDLHIHVLTTAPYKHNSLYPYATPRPKVIAHDILVLLSESPASATDDSPRVFVAAIEAALYLFPTTDSALLYISKVDSTGQGSAPSPTSTLVRAFVDWHASSRNVQAARLWVQLFARAQAQYLFPNSAEFEGKKPLSDVRLCAWWRRVLGDAAAACTGSRAFYVLPGYGALEAEQALGGSDVRWTYGHPYNQLDSPVPCPPPHGDIWNLGNIIPSFEDDPKNRFMDELAHADTVNERDASPVKKKPRLEKKDEAEVQRRKREKEKEESKGPRGELARVQADEFWERMSFRQECVAGAVTGFFAVVFTLATPSDTSADASSSVNTATPVSKQDTPNPMQPRPGHVPRHINERVLKLLSTGVEFSTTERARKGTEVVESSLKGLCEGIASRPPNSSAAPARPRVDASGQLLPAQSLPHDDPPSTPTRRAVALPENVSPNPFDEPEATLETYNAHIYGSVNVRNDPPLPKVAAAVSDPAKVNVLSVRKKKKKPE